MKYHEKGVKLGCNDPAPFNEEEWSACKDIMLHLPTGRMYCVRAEKDEFGTIDPSDSEAKLLSSGKPMPTRDEFRLQCLQAISVFLVREGCIEPINPREKPKLCRRFRRQNLVHSVRCDR
jgi:hypothetical protein